MLRSRITLLYLVLVTALVATTVVWVRYDVQNLVRTDAEVALRRSATLAEQSARLDEAALLEKAEYVASSERLYRSLEGDFVDEPEEGEEGAEKFDFEGQRHLDAHEKLTAQKYKLGELLNEATSQRNVEYTTLERKPHQFDIFMVVDAEGQGVAALGKDLYSWFGTDVASDHPSVEEVLDGGPDAARVDFWMWSFSPSNEKRLYRVALAPVQTEIDGETAGVVVLGNAINDGTAQSKQRLFAGLTREEEEEAEFASQMEAAPEVAFFRGTDIVGSTFGSARQKELSAAMQDQGIFDADSPEVTVELDVGEDPHIALVRRFKRGAQGPSVGVAVFRNLEVARAPLGAITVNMAIVGVLFLLLGAFLIFFFTVRYIRPVEDLEDGIQEIIAGNKDHVFHAIEGHELQSGLAQQLNLMSAFLQGKPMPDEEDVGGGWGDLMGGGEVEQSGPSQVQGVDLANLSAPPSEDDGGEQ